MRKKNTYKTPSIKEIGNASEIIKGLAAGKELGGDDGLTDGPPDNNPVSVPD